MKLGTQNDDIVLHTLSKFRKHDFVANHFKKFFTCTVCVYSVDLKEFYTSPIL